MLRPRGPGGHAVQVPHLHPGRPVPGPLRPLRLLYGAAPQQRLHSVGPVRLLLPGPGLAEPPQKLAGGPPEHLRAPPGLLAAEAGRRLVHLPGAGRAADFLCQGTGVQRPGVSPPGRAPQRLLLGVSDHRLFQPHLPVRHPGRPEISGGPVPPGGAGRPAGLCPRPLRRG